MTKKKTTNLEPERSRLVRVLLLGVLLVLAGSPLFALDGREIAQRVHDRDTGETTHSLVQMVLRESGGDTSTRTVENWIREADDGTSSSVVVFHEPASVKDTRFLTIENKGRDDDQWIFLPGLGRVRRIAASEGDSSFMGTDFTYDDMQSREVDEDIHKLIKEEQAEGYNCYVVESLPKESSPQYSKRLQWVAKENWIPVKIELYDSDGELHKVLTIGRIEKVQGFWTAIDTTMTNVRTDHSTDLNIKKLVYNEKVPEGLFTVNFLRTGRP